MVLFLLFPDILRQNFLFCIYLMDEREALTTDGFVIKNQVAVIYFLIKLTLSHIRLDQFASHFVWNTRCWLKLTVKSWFIFNFCSLFVLQKVEEKLLIYSEISETMIMQTSEILESAFSPQCQCVPWISNFHSCKFLFGSVHTKNVRILGVRKKG